MSKTKEQLLASAEEIRTNTAPNSNTADLVGSTLKDMINKSSDDKDELQNNIDELSEGSSEVISSVRSDLSSEVARAKAAENAAAAAVTAEKTRAKAAESALNTSLTGVKSDMNTLSLVNDGVKYAGLIGIDDDTNKYAANAVPTDKRKVGLIVTYLDKNGNPQTYQFTGSNISQWLTITTWQGIDDVPTAGSDNLVKSGGVFNNIGALDISELNATENPHTLAAYEDLASALNALPISYRKGGMSVKYVQSSDNKYVQYRLMANTFSTTESDWQGVDDEPSVGNENLVKSSGIFNAINKVFSDENLLLNGAVIHSNVNRRAASAKTAVVGDVYDLTPTTDYYYKFYKIPVIEKTKYTIGVVARREAKVWAFLDKDLKVLSIENETSADVKIWNESVIEAPEGSKWLIVHTYRNDAINSYYADKVFIQNALSDEINNRIKADELEENITTSLVNAEANSLILDNGNMQGIANTCIVRKIEVKEGEKYRLVSKVIKSGNYNTIKYAVYNSTTTYNSTTAILLGEPTGGTLDVELTIPIGGKLLCVSDRTTSQVELYKVTTLSDVDKSIKDVNNQISNIDSDIQDINLKLDGVSNRTLPLGVCDNFFQYFVKKVFIRDYFANLFHSFGAFTKDENNKYTELDLQMMQKGNNHLKGVSFILCIKKQTDKWLLIENQSGAVISYKLNELVTGQDIYVRQGSGSLSTILRGKVLFADDDIAQIYITQGVGTNDYRYIVCVASTFRRMESTEYYSFELVEEYCGLFWSEGITIDVQAMTHYESRAEKLKSNLLGKSAICFGDSLSKYMCYLLMDWGLTIHMFGTGGGKMGYDNDASHWICGNTVIQRFKDDSYRPDSVDYIINMDGTNENPASTWFNETDSTEIQFVYNNKNWFDKNLETDPFDSLTQADKERFTGTACYIVAFYSLAQLYPTAQAVVVEPFFNRAGPDSFEDGKWKNIESFAAVYFADQSSLDLKKNTLRTIAKNLNAIFVSNNTKIGMTNAPSQVTDGTHPSDMGQDSKAWTIAMMINFPADIDNLIY